MNRSTGADLADRRRIRATIEAELEVWRSYDYTQHSYLMAIRRTVDSIGPDEIDAAIDRAVQSQPLASPEDGPGFAQAVIEHLLIIPREPRNPTASEAENLDPERIAKPARRPAPWTVRLQSRFDRFFYRYGMAGFFSWTAGLVGAAVFLAFSFGPGWLGFVAAYLPASIIAAWATIDG